MLLKSLKPTALFDSIAHASPANSYIGGKLGAKPAGKVPAGPKPLVADRVDLLGEKKPSGLAVNSPVGTVYDYDVSDYHQLVVKVVNAQNRAEVVRQYPSEESLSLKDAYRRFLKLIGM